MAAPIYTSRGTLITDQTGSVDVDLTGDDTPPNGLGSWFAQLTTTHRGSAGRDTPAAANLNNADLGATFRPTDDDTATLVRVGTAEAVDHHFDHQTVQCRVPSTDPYYFEVVLDEIVTLSAGVKNVTSSVAAASGGGNPDGLKCAVIIGGVRHNLTNSSWGDVLVTARILISRSNEVTVRLRRGSSVGNTSVSVQLIYFAGSAWNVQTNIIHEMITAGAWEDIQLNEAISSWDQGFILPSFRTPSGLHGLDEVGCLVTAHPSDTSKARGLLVASASQIPPAILGLDPYRLNLAVISAAGLSVQHKNSFDGTATAFLSTDTEKTTAITAVDLDRASLMGSTGICTGSGTSYPRGHMGLTFDDDSTVRIRRGRDGQFPLYAFQAVQWPADPAIAPPKSFGRVGQALATIQATAPTQARIERTQASLARVSASIGALSGIDRAKATTATMIYSTTIRIREGQDVWCPARVVGPEGTVITTGQSGTPDADVDTYRRNIYDITDGSKRRELLDGKVSTGTSVGTAHAFTGTLAVFTSLQTDGYWSLDSTGYNVIDHIRDATSHLEGGHTYRVEVVLEGADFGEIPLTYIVQVAAADEQ